MNIKEELFYAAVNMYGADYRERPEWEESVNDLYNRVVAEFGEAVAKSIIDDAYSSN